MLHGAPPYSSFPERGITEDTPANQSYAKQWKRSLGFGVKLSIAGSILKIDFHTVSLCTMVLCDKEQKKGGMTIKESNVGARKYTGSKHSLSLPLFEPAKGPQHGHPCTKTAVNLSLVLEYAADSGGICMTGVESGVWLVRRSHKEF